ANGTRATRKFFEAGQAFDGLAPSSGLTPEATFYRAPESLRTGQAGIRGAHVYYAAQMNAR
ncbi:MAG TPA: hypothetical protein VIQ24_08140, partial [Pyrinomonadaceae bacterium]